MNWNLLGHEWAVDLLRTHVGRGEVRHAYLISGPQGVGRRTLALRLAQAINCEQPPAPGDPCLACRSCRQIAAMQHPDLSIIQTPPDKTQILVEQVRELQHSLALHPYAARYRVALLLRFEEAGIATQNALLKTLEEPPPQVVLLLTAENPELLLPTISSRCELLRLRPAPLDGLSGGLQTAYGVEAAQATLLAHIAGGRPGIALQMLNDPQALEQRQALLDEHLHLVYSGRAERFAFADYITKESKNRERGALRDLLLAWQSLWRDVLLCSAGAGAQPANLDRQEQIIALAARVDLASARRALSCIEQTLLLLKGNVNARLAMEVLMLNLPFLA
ncbi:MAG: ATP-binding protein [Chloroflexota bacterium]